MKRALVVGVFVLMALAGCGNDTPPATTSGPAPAGAPIAASQQAFTAPEQGYEISIPDIGMTSSLIPLGLNADRTIQVPPLSAVEQAGFYDQGPRPGEDGPAVVLCHVNGGGQPGCGARFAELRGGDEIEVDTPDGPVTFRVYDTATVRKGDFPTSRVWSDTEGPELRLITCGPGPVVGHEYINQHIIWAKKA